MLSEELKNYIAVAIEDGELEDFEIALLRRKAEEFGDDADEAVMTAKAELAKAKKASAPLPQGTASKPAKEKLGNIRTCPACGATVDAFQTKCPICGHELRNTDVSKALQEFIAKLDRSIGDNLRQNIENFPIPNTKEDILEFVIFASSKSVALCKEPPSDSKSGRESQLKLISSWESKLQQADNKAKIACKDDPVVMGRIEAALSELKTAKVDFVKKSKTAAAQQAREESLHGFTSGIAGFFGAIGSGIVSFFSFLFKHPKLAVLIVPALIIGSCIGVNAARDHFFVPIKERVFAENEVAINGVLGECFTVTDAVIKSTDGGNGASLIMTVKKTAPTSPVIDKAINETLKVKGWRRNDCEITPCHDKDVYIKLTGIDGLYWSSWYHETSSYVSSLINLDVGKSTSITLPVHRETLLETQGTGIKAKKFIKSVMEMPGLRLEIQAKYRITNHKVKNEYSNPNYAYAYIK